MMNCLIIDLALSKSTSIISTCRICEKRGGKNVWQKRKQFRCDQSKKRIRSGRIGGTRIWRWEKQAHAFPHVTIRFELEGWNEKLVNKGDDRNDQSQRTDNT